MKTQKLFKRHIYMIIWGCFSILLFFAFFGSTDEQGFHHGWLITTRPGWLWSAGCFYIAVVAAGWIAARRIGYRKRNSSNY
jgi:hypothetical protein